MRKFVIARVIICKSTIFWKKNSQNANFTIFSKKFSENRWGRAKWTYSSDSGSSLVNGKSEMDEYLGSQGGYKFINNNRQLRMNEISGSLSGLKRKYLRSPYFENFKIFQNLSIWQLFLKKFLSCLLRKNLFSVLVECSIEVYKYWP